MNETILKCSDERRRQMVREQADSYDGLNGIDYVEVIDGTGQRELCVHFFGDVPDNLVPANVRIECGERIRDIKVLKIEPHRSDDPMHEDCLRVRVDKAGDFSCYKLCLYELEKDGDTSDTLLKNFDPRYACATFSFKIDCPGTLDCKDENLCPPESRDEPDINYLAKDYASFRQLILDRLALLMPNWRERHVPDIGVALVEVLAYVGDYLSYYQDAAATEAYLDTARLRISVRRHARLVDYFMHEGCNARAWVCLKTDEPRETLDAKDFYFITGSAKLSDYGLSVISQDELDELNIARDSYDVFEPLVEDKDKKIQIYNSHNEIKFYTWENAECCLPRGATRATLLDKWAKSKSPAEQTPAQQSPEQQKLPEKEEISEEQQKFERELRLQVGDVLIFEEVFGAKTGDPADADPKHRCAVRLTRVEPREDPLTKTPIVEIEWSQADALPFALCLSARLRSPDCSVRKDISVARGNVILVDHGETVWEKIDGIVPTAETPGECLCEGSSVEFTDVPGRFRFALKNAPVTFRQSLSAEWSASTRLIQDARAALPHVTLHGEPSDIDEESVDYFEELKTVWKPKFDLLASDADERGFVVEIDNDGRARIRFGDGDCGCLPEAGTSFAARYRIGNGGKGNVGVETINYMVTRIVNSGSSIQPRNPMPAQGGTEAEPIAEVKLFAPGAFRKKLERAITAEDYAHLAGLNAKIQRASANLRWNGSWHEARVAVDPFGIEALSEELSQESEGSLYRYRRIGHDLTITGARYVPLDIKFEICVAPHYLRGHVEAALREAFGKGVLIDGRRGFFHPDNLTFGGGVYLTALVAAAHAVEGVVSARVTKLQRLFESANDEIANGVLPLAKNEIARFDNNPNFPERGRLALVLTGGR